MAFRAIIAPHAARRLGLFTFSAAAVVAERFCSPVSFHLHKAAFFLSLAHAHTAGLVFFSVRGKSVKSD